MANLLLPQLGIFGSTCGAGVTSTSTPVTACSRQTWPPKMKVSPGDSISRKPSSISPSLRPGRPPRAAIRTLSMAGEMIAPTFMRCRRTVSASRATHRPSRVFTIRRKRS